MMIIAAAQAAAKLIEIDGAEAYRACAERYGEDVALVLVVAHLRRSHGAMDKYPPDPAIDEIVIQQLIDSGIINTKAAVYVCPNCSQEANVEDRCIACGTYFCNRCMALKTEPEIDQSDKPKCPHCGSMNTKSINH